MQTKQIDLMVKEAPGDVPGIIAYASTFDRIPDAYGDVVAKGAFAGTLQRLKESGRNLPLLYGHVMDDPAAIIGTVTKAVEDDHGLLVEATFDMESPNAQQVRRAVLSKAITKLSFAFSVLDQHTIELEGYGEVNELTELEIYEVSLVVVPANPRAQVVEAKDAPLKSDEPVLADDTEPETDPEVKAEEPMEAKAEEPEEKAEEEEPENINPVSEKEQTMDIETMNAIADAAPAEKSLTEIVAETFVGKKDGSRFTLATPEIKAATWMGTPAIQEITREVPALKKPLGIADAFSTIAISGNTYVYVPVTPKDGTFAAVAEGAAKPLVDYNKTPVVVPLTKYAGIMKFSDEIMEDAEWLVSEITGQGEWDLERVMDAAAWTTLNGASGIGSYTATSDMVNDAINAAAQAYAASGYKSDIIFMNPVDFAAAKVASRSLPGEAYISADGIDRLTVIESDQVTAGTAIVGNSRFAKRILKGGRRVESTNSNDTDFEHNLVTVRVEQRGAFAITLPQAFVKIA